MYGFKTSDREHLELKLRDAAERGDIGEVARLIESGVSVNSNHGVSLLQSNPIYTVIENIFIPGTAANGINRFIHVLWLRARDMHMKLEHEGGEWPCLRAMSRLYILLPAP